MLTPPISDFPPDVLKWMKENASPRQSFKLMKMNKFFQQRPFPFTIVNSLDISEKENFRGRVTNFRCSCKNKPSVFVEYIEEVPDDLWLLYDLILRNWNNIIPQLLPKIVYCQVQVLRLKKQELSWDDWGKISEAGKIQHLNFNNTLVKGKNNGAAALEDMLVTLPIVQQLM